MIVGNIPVQHVTTTDSNGSLAIRGSGTPTNFGNRYCAERETLHNQDNTHDGFTIDPAIQRSVYKNTDKVIPLSIHNLFLIKYM